MKKQQQHAYKQEARKNPAFKASEKELNRASKQRARKNPDVLARERAAKVSARKNPAFKAKEIECQRSSKQNARKDPFVLECERIKQQQNRQQKRKLDMSALANKRCKSVKEDNLHDHQSYRISDQKGFKSIKDCVTQFHSNIAVGPVFVCTYCHQTWFRKSVSMLKNTHIPAQNKRLYCTKFASVHNEEWVCHTCLTALRNSNIPKLSVVNGMK